jgi:uncharacterized protein
VRIYLDSSAVLKRVLLESESLAFIATLDRFAEEGATLLSSTLTRIEVTRSLRRQSDREPPAEIADRVETALSGMVECPISEQIVSIARRIGPSSLRSLDAIHLASAAVLDVDLVCAYDQRMLTAAAELGFRTLSPS